MTNMALTLRNRNIKMMEEYMVHQNYEGNFIADINEEDAEGGLAKLKKDAEEMM